MQRKIQKKEPSTAAKGYLSIGMLVISGFLFASITKDTLLYMDLKVKNEENTRILQEKLEYKEELETTKKNLTNPDYLEYIARGRYYASSDDGQVFVFPSTDDSAGN